VTNNVEALNNVWMNAGFPDMLESPGFFPGSYRPWKVPESEFGPEVLEIKA